MSGGAHPLQLSTDATYPYAISVLCLIFLAILLAWDIAVGTLSFILGNWSHLREVLIGRLKEELLALGVVSLIVAFIEPRLAKTCLPSPGDAAADAVVATPEGSTLPAGETPAPLALRMLLAAEGGESTCPEGRSQLFPPHVVAMSHYLLFWVAMVQIGYTLLSALCSGIRHLRMNRWEQAARHNLVDFAGSKYERHSSLSIAEGSEAAMARVQMVPGPDKVAVNIEGIELPSAVSSKQRAGCCFDWLKSVRYTVFHAGMTRQKYSLLRQLLLLRVQCDPHAAELRTMNLVVASEQLTQHESSYVHAHTWLQILAIALITLYNDRASQVVWAGPFILVGLIILIWKLHSIASRASELISERAPDLSLLPTLNPTDSGMGTFPSARKASAVPITRYTGEDVDGKHTVDANELASQVLNGAGPGELETTPSGGAEGAGGGLLRLQARRNKLEDAAAVVVNKGSLVSSGSASMKGADSDAKYEQTKQLLGPSAENSSADSTPSKAHGTATGSYVHGQNRGLSAGDGTPAVDASPWTPPGVMPGLDRAMTLQHHPQLLTQVMELQQDLLKLWWFKWPRLMLWLIELVSVVICGMLTYSFYLISNSGQSSHGRNLTVILVDIVFALLCSMYVGWVFYPQFALLYTAIAAEPRQILHHLKWNKVLDEEEHHGVSGLTTHVLESAHHRCAHGHGHSHHHALHPSTHGDSSHHDSGASEAAPTDTQSALSSHVVRALGASRAARTKALVDAWVVSLALRSGVLMPGQQAAESQAYLMQHAPLFLSCALTWRHKAMVQQGKEQPPVGGYVIRGKSWLGVFYEVFDGLDEDRSGVITDQEMQEHMRRSFNVQLNNSELNAMMHEVAASGSSAVVDYGQATAAHPLDPPGVPLAPVPAEAAAHRLLPVGRQHHRRRGVNFRNFVLFAAFAFLDSHKKGYLDLHGLRTTLQLNGVKIEDWQLGAMISYATHNHGHQVGSVQFLHIFDDVQLLAE